jgi:hypothetical protein
LLAFEVAERIQVPGSIVEWKRTPNLRERAMELQTANRVALESAFQRNLAAIGYERDAEGNGTFLLGTL